MSLDTVVQAIDDEIANLQHARSLLVGLGAPTRRGPGRPKGSGLKPSGKRRNISPAGRKRIAEAMKKRWAARRKEEAAKVPAKSKKASAPAAPGKS